MKNFTAFLVAMVMTICTLFSSASALNADAVSIVTTKQTMVDYLQQFENPYYGSTAGEFDLNNDDRIDVFDLTILKRKFVDGEDGVTVRTVEKLQDWLLAKPYAELTITSCTETKFFDDINDYDTQIIQNLMSNDFRYVHADSKDVDGFFCVTLWFLNYDENLIEGATFKSFTDTLDYADEVIAEADGFYITIQDGKYVLSFKEQILSADDEEIAPTEATEETEITETTEIVEPEVEYEPEEPSKDIGPALAKIDLISADKTIIPTLENYANAADYTKTIFVDEICKIATVHFETPRAELYVVVPISDSDNISGTVVYYCEEFIIFYSDEEEGFRISIK